MEAGSGYQLDSLVRTSLPEPTGLLLCRHGEPQHLDGSTLMRNELLEEGTCVEMVKKLRMLGRRKVEQGPVETDIQL